MLTHTRKVLQNNKKDFELLVISKSIFQAFSFIDSTEQQIPSPVDKRKRKAYYSGKKKIHTVKTQLMVNNHGFIIHNANHKKGHRHDYDVYKKNHPVTPKQVVNVVDLRYLVGIEKDFPQQLYHPHLIERREIKSPSAGHKKYNKNHSKKRIVIEHTICRLKKYSRILA
jgi:hypothetical protein